MNPLLAALLRRLLIPNLFVLGVDAPAPAAPAPAPAAPAPAPAAPAPAPAAPAASPAPAAPAASPAPAAPAPSPAPAAPAQYTLKLADGSPLDPTEVDKVAAYARERGLSNEQAQEELDRRNTTASEFAQGQIAQFEKRKSEWETQTWGDPELGGTHKDGTLANVKLVMDKFAPGDDHPLRKELVATGYGNHPTFVRFVNAIGKAMREDKPINGGAGASGQRTAADVLYGSGSS